MLNGGKEQGSSTQINLALNNVFISLAPTYQNKVVQRDWCPIYTNNTTRVSHAIYTSQHAYNLQKWCYVSAVELQHRDISHRVDGAHEKAHDSKSGCEGT